MLLTTIHNAINRAALINAIKRTTITSAMKRTTTTGAMKRTMLVITRYILSNVIKRKKR